MPRKGPLSEMCAPLATRAELAANNFHRFRFYEPCDAAVVPKGMAWEPSTRHGDTLVVAFARDPYETREVQHRWKCIGVEDGVRYLRRRDPKPPGPKPPLKKRR